MSLRTRILLLVLLATLAPAAMFGFFFFNERNRDIDEAKQHLGALARYAAENLDDKIRGTVQLLHGLSRAPEINTADQAACSAFLAEVLAKYPQYTGLLTITPDGDLHCDSLRTGRKLNLSGRDYFRQARASLGPAFDIVTGGLTGITVLQVAFPALDSQGALKYVLLASLNLSRYTEDFVAASHYPGIVALIWDRKGILMVHTAGAMHADLVGRDFASSELFRFVASGNTGMAATLPGLKGVQRVWSLGAVPEPRGGGARIVLGVEEDMLVAEANRGLRDALVLLLGVSAMAFAGAWFVAETGIRRHLRRMANVAARVGAGDLGARIGPPYPRGELGELMAVVDRTSVAVQAQQAVIASSSRDLHKVNRTLRVISGINALIVRVRDREELFRETCNIAVKEGGFCMSMIAIMDRNTKTIVPVASAGVDEELLTAVKVHLSTDGDAPGGETTFAKVIREKKAAVSNVSPDNPAVMFGKKFAGSTAVLPLDVSNQAIGVLALYALEREIFGEAEMKLLSDLAGNIEFAIDHIGKKERLDYLAYYDELTGLANRALFLERVAQYIRGAVNGGHKLAVFFVDLERFRNINASLGRQAGDALLKQVSEWLSRAVGDPNLLARLGADQFAMVLPEMKREGNVEGLLDKGIRALLDHPFLLHDMEVRITLKVDVALFPNDGTDADTLLHNAEAALNKAKASGNRYLFYTQKMTDAEAGNLTLENQLRQALEKNEFVLHYQPKVNLESGKVTGAEALIRWYDPRTGLVPPGRFIPILEETGLIYDVGRWALRQAIADYLRWRAAGLHAVRIAVNVSPLQLRNRDFISEIQRKIAIDSHAPAGLELEITESLIMEDVKHNIASLLAIRAMGVTVAIDDFGTGFSSLSYLAKLPVDTLKIDRSFVIDMTTGPDGLTLVSTIIALAHSLKLKVVAEGVETEEQSRLLQLLKCDEMQGFLFSKPVPAEIFETRFLARVPVVAAA